jgi:hypothetical protein
MESLLANNTLSPDKIQKQIDTLTKKIARSSNDISMNIVFFVATVCVLLVFVYIIVHGAFTSLKMYYHKLRKANANEKMRESKDDFFYDEYTFDQSNQLNLIENNIMLKHKKQEIAFQPLMEWKKKNELPSEKLEAQVDLTVLEKEFDSYEYDITKNGMSFWKMLLMPPKYLDLVNTTDRCNIKKLF